MNRHYAWILHCPNCDKQFTWELKTETYVTSTGTPLCSKDCWIEFTEKMRKTKLTKYTEKKKLTKEDEAMYDYITAKWAQILSELDERRKGHKKRILQDCRA